MSIRAIPTLVIVFILYNLIAITGSASPEELKALGAGSVADAVFRQPLITVPMISGDAKWTFSWGDLIILLTFVFLFAELLKSTYTTGVSLIDHGLSMLLFIACLIEFLLVDKAATSVFFFIMIACLIDVVAGYTIGIRTARRDLNIGGAGGLG